METSLTAAFPLETRLRCRDGHMTADLGGEVAILNMETGAYYGLDAIGSRIWSILGGGCTVGGLRDAILAEYDVAPAQCEEDLQRLLGDLARHQLVERDETPAATN
jgi:hypothetical protein